MTSGVNALVKDKVHRKIFHGRIEKLLNHSRKPVDLINKEYVPFFQMGQNAQQIAAPLQGRTTAHRDLNTHFFSNDVGKGCLAQTRGGMKQDVIQWLFTLECSLNGNTEGLYHLGLTDIFLQTLRPEAYEL